MSTFQDLRNNGKKTPELLSMLISFTKMVSTSHGMKRVLRSPVSNQPTPTPTPLPSQFRAPSNSGLQDPPFQPLNISEQKVLNPL